MKFVFNWEEQYDWPSETEKKINEGINKMIHEEVDKKTEEMQTTIKFLIEDNIKRFWLSKIFWIFLVISVALNFVLIYLLME